MQLKGRSVCLRRVNQVLGDTIWDLGCILSHFFTLFFFYRVEQSSVEEQSKKRIAEIIIGHGEIAT